LTAGSIERAAAVCLDDSGRVLLVKTSDGLRWTFPKGRIERDERAADAALREAREEGGILGEIDERPLTTYLSPKGDEMVPVRAFLLRVSGQVAPQEDFREPSWFPAEEAIEQLRINREGDVGDAVGEAVRLAVARSTRSAGAPGP
jgi:8-oxo-dGTP pyrophosphatase MutT (NUDIX family)